MCIVLLWKCDKLCIYWFAFRCTALWDSPLGCDIALYKNIFIIIIIIICMCIVKCPELLWEGCSIQELIIIIIMYLGGLCLFWLFLYLFVCFVIVAFGVLYAYFCCCCIFVRLVVDVVLLFCCVICFCFVFYFAFVFWLLFLFVFFCFAVIVFCGFFWGVIYALHSKIINGGDLLQYAYPMLKHTPH